MLKTDMYTITKTLNALHSGLRWVSLAMSRDETRYVLNHIKIEGKTAQASDGRRLHVLTDESLDIIEDGLYDVIKQNAKEILLAKSDCDGTFPNTAQVIPTSEGSSFEVLAGSHKEDAAAKLLFQLGKRDLARVDPFYAGDMFAFNSEGMKVQVVDKLSAIKFTSKGRVGVLMPLRTD